MTLLIRTVVSALFVAILAAPAPAATQEQIDAAIARGAARLKQLGPNGAEIGRTALVGLALLESGARYDEPSLKAITEAVRNECFIQYKTYEITLCLLYLDRYGDPADIPLVQMLALRLLHGHGPGGGWGYNCLDIPILADEAKAIAARFRGAKTEPGKMHPEATGYAKVLASRGRPLGTEDNSNTQFGILGLWVARKHGVPVDAALDLVVERFLRTQDPNTGTWNYTNVAPGSPVVAGAGSPSMICAGLLALATGAARRDEKYLKAIEKKQAETPAKTPDNPPGKASDQFFTPGGAKPVDKLPKRAPDRIDLAIRGGFAALAGQVAASSRAGNGPLILNTKTGHGEHDFYFFWSLERVGVVYGVEKIGGVDWYMAGADTLVRHQGQDGSWSGNYGMEVDTSFAILFLTRANVVKDLKMARTNSDAELRSTTGPGGANVEPKGPGTNTGTDVTPVKPMLDPATPKPVLPFPMENESTKLATELLSASPADWDKKLTKLRETRGGDYTGALVLAIPRLDGDRKQDARDALAERLVRMNADTLREMMKGRDPELRRGAALAAAMKDDKSLIPDLIDRLLDDEEFVARAARAGLKSLSEGKDFGPANGASKSEREAAAKAWREWAAKK